VKQQEDDKRRRSEAMRDISNSRHPPRRRRDKVALSVSLISQQRVVSITVEKQFLQISLYIENLILNEYDRYSGNEMRYQIIPIL
jgi:hypothetical protein